MAEIEEIRKCRHCGNLRVFELVVEHTKVRHDKISDLHDSTTWRILQCPACLRLTLEEIYQIEDDDDPTEKVLYPSSNTIISNLPYRIAQEYEKVLKVRDISPNACAVLVRRILETICRYEKARGKDLNEKIQVLAHSGRIPQTLANMAQLLRQIGNLGAHVDKDDDEVTSDDVTTMIDFLEAILEYLYVAPAKLATVQARLKKAP